MRMLSKAILAALVAVMIGGTIALASGGTGIIPSPSTTAGNSVRTVPSTTAIDVKGSCDEAEHANDATCDQAQVREDRNDDNGAVPDQEGPDDSGHHSGSDSATEISTDNAGPRGGEIEAGDDSGHSTELEAGDDSGHGSDNLGHHEGSERDHSKDN
jgi:hypothetical protein